MQMFPKSTLSNPHEIDSIRIRKQDALEQRFAANHCLCFNIASMHVLEQRLAVNCNKCWQWNLGHSCDTHFDWCRQTIDFAIRILNHKFIIVIRRILAQTRLCELEPNVVGIPDENVTRRSFRMRILLEQLFIVTVFLRLLRNRSKIKRPRRVPSPLRKLRDAKQRLKCRLRREHDLPACASWSVRTKFPKVKYSINGIWKLRTMDGNGVFSQEQSWKIFVESVYQATHACLAYW